MAESHREEIAKLEALYAGNPGGRVFVHLAEAYRKAGEHERARRILDEGLARHADSASGYVVLGRVLSDMQITDEAEIAFRRVLELDGGNLIALRWLGDLARQGGRNAEAAMHYRELLIRNPSNEEVRDLVDIVEREGAEGPASRTAAGDAEDAEVDAFAGLSLDTAEDRSGPAVSPPLSAAEEPAVMPPVEAAEAQEPDVTSWSAAPGQTGDAEESPVEYGMLEIDTGTVEAAPPERDADYTASDTEPAALEPASGHADLESAGGVPEVRPVTFELGREDESDLVSSLDEDDTDVLELDELRRDDEAEPLEIHLLDPSYEASGEEDEDEYVAELDLSDLASTGPLDDADDYADDSFVADLSAAGEEAAPADELPGGVDVMDAALTLLPDEGEAATEEPRPEQPEAEIELLETDIEAAIRSETFEPQPESADSLTAESVEEFPAIDSGEPLADSDSDATLAGRDQLGGDLTGSDLAELSGVSEPAAEATPVPEPLGAAALEPQEAPAPEPEQAPAPEPEETRAAEVRPGAETGLVTETMAVLYRSQGFHDRAADVYRALLRVRPDDERLAARLREAEEAAGAAGRKRQPAAEPASEDDAGEVWLRGVGAAWTAPSDADTAAAEATPYAWTGEADEGERGEPISSYLQDLVSWKSGSGVWVQPDAADADTAAADIEMPDWLDGPGEAQPWAPDSESAGYTGTSAAEHNWGPPPAEPWDAAGGTTEEAAAADGSEAGLDEWQMPTEPAGTPPIPAADADVGGEWTPLNLDEGAVAGPATPSAGTPQAGTPPGGPQREPSSDEDSSDDDDLEMFRSWLQSLKK